MPLPEEVLQEIAEGLDKAKAGIDDLKDTISDMRKAKLDTEFQDKRLAELEATYRQMLMFHGYQVDRWKQKKGEEQSV